MVRLSSQYKCVKNNTFERFLGAPLYRAVAVKRQFFNWSCFPVIFLTLVVKCFKMVRLSSQYKCVKNNTFERFLGAPLYRAVAVKRQFFKWSCFPVSTGVWLLRFG